MPTPEFIFLNDQAARVTSLVPDDATGHDRLVVIARGSGDRDHLLDLLRDPGLQVRFGPEPSTPMRATNIDIRSTGDGPQAVHRIQAELAPVGEEPVAGPPATPRSVRLDDRPDIDSRLDRIIELLTEIRDLMKPGR